MTGNSQKKWNHAKEILARFIYREDARCPFEDEVEECSGKITVEDINHYPKEGTKGSTYPNLVWHHLDDDKEKAQNYKNVPEVEDPEDVVLAHKHCHQVHNGNLNLHNVQKK